MARSATKHSFMRCACRMLPFRGPKNYWCWSLQGNSDVPAAAEQMCRLFGPCGGAARQDVLVSPDMDASSDGETDCEA